jgi:hypothetical protein
VRRTVRHRRAAGRAPATDDRGLVDSTARCAAPDSAVAFGRTDSSRVAICVDPDGRYEYRGVRVRDGATLITSAEPSGDGGFVAENDGVTYTVTASSLVVAVGERVIRDEPMVDFQEPDSPAEPKPPAEPEPPAETAPLPPPLPAEAGAG